MADGCRSVAIVESDEPLVDIPAAAFAFTEPHPYVALGAPYGDASPWRLRCGVLDALLRAADRLAERRPGWRLRLFDAWRLVPATPPPHSTGAAIDLTLADAAGREVDMGCPIDETTERAYPDHYASASVPGHRVIHGHRQLLHEVMSAAGFSRHVNEWWHFSTGDQMAAFTRGDPFARRGRAA